MLRSFLAILIAGSFLHSTVAFAQENANAPIYGFSAQHAQSEREWETKFRAIPNPQKQRDAMQLLSARPHHVGSAYDKQNAEWIL